MNSKLCISSSHQPWHGFHFHESVTKRVAPPRPRVHLIKKVSHPKESIDEFISTLPQRKGWSQPLVQYKNFWFRGQPLEHILLAQDAFEPRADDIILATQPKCGTTWLKALAFTIVNRSRHSFDDHPLLTSHPQRVVPFIEIPGVVGGTDHHAHIETLSSPRLLATHIPMSLLPLDMSARVVYVCRDPKDALVSRLFFENRITQGSDLSMDSAFSMFCEGFSSYGPFWDHCLEYWKESLARPNNVLFLKYEEIKSDPVQVVRRLAKFLGFPLSQEEESSGVALEVVRLCSFEMLISLKVNQVGGILIVETNVMALQVQDMVLCAWGKLDPETGLVMVKASLKEATDEILIAIEEARTGVFTPNRENDELTRALKNREHPERTRGKCVVPWFEGFADWNDDYRSRARKKMQL